MKKKVIIITSIIILLLLITVGSIVENLINDFGIDSLGKSIVALYQLKTNKNIDYVEINENVYMVKNKEIRRNTSFIDDTKNNENKEEQILEPAIFKIYKDNVLYSVEKMYKEK